MCSMKIAISGKGGVGKTTIASTIARLMGRSGKKVVMVDCDPSPNLALSLGISQEERKKIVPLCQLYDLVAERTGVRPGESQGKLYKINPEVDDLLGKYGVKGKDNVILIVLGTIQTGGGGCFCPESALLKRLLSHLVRKEDVLIMDMEAGVEHLGRGTTRNIDILLIVVEPGQRSIETASRIKKLAKDLGLPRIVAVLNKSRGRSHEEEIGGRLKDLDIKMIGSIPYSEIAMESDLKGISLLDTEGNQPIIEAVENILEKLIPGEPALGEL